MFKIRARNIYGWGDFSPIAQIRTSDSPGQMEIVYTDSFVDAIDGISKVRITFSEPEANGEYISKYQIMVQKYDGVTFIEDTTHCDGSDSQVIANMYCDIPMTTLRAAPYSLTKGMLIKVIARAYNLYQWGQFSQVNVDGATLETEPVGILTLTYLDTSISNNV